MGERPDYYSRVNETLLDAIPADARAVLEVGCGTGALARRYKARNPTSKWSGIEPAADACWEIEAAVSSFHFGAIEEYPEGAFPDGVFDCLVFGDVLEHLEDPLGQLKKCVDWLRDGGQVVASIPNVGHYSVILALLAQNWAYQDEGLLDRTHLRFFTRNTIEELFRDAGLAVFDVVPRRLGNERFDEFMGAIKSSKDWPRFAVDLGKLEDQASAFQYVVVGVKGEAPRNELLVRPFYGAPCCRNPRLAEPGKFMGTIPGVKYSESPVDAREWESVVVVRQRGNFDVAEVAKQVERGAIVVGEWDDDPRVFVDGFDDGKAPFDVALRGCHAIQVSTEAVAETVRGWNPEVAVFPNQLMEIPPPREYAEGGPVRIFYGAQNRESDWLPVMPALNRVLAEFGDRVRVEVVHDRAFYEALAVGPGRKTWRPFLSYDEYRGVLRRCDIALLPMEPSEFNRHKSDIKFLECAAEGVAVLAGDTVYFDTVFMQLDRPCEEVDPIGETYSSPEAFERTLRVLIESPGFRRVLAKGAYEYVRDHRLLKDHYKTRVEWYRGLVARKAELDEQLRARAPELFEGADDRRPSDSSGDRTYDHQD